MQILLPYLYFCYQVTRKCSFWKEKFVEKTILNSSYIATKREIHFNSVIKNKNFNMAKMRQGRSWRSCKGFKLSFFSNLIQHSFWMHCMYLLFVVRFQNCFYFPIAFSSSFVWETNGYTWLIMVRLKSERVSEVTVHFMFMAKYFSNMRIYLDPQKRRLFSKKFAILRKHEWSRHHTYWQVWKIAW